MSGNFGPSSRRTNGVRMLVFSIRFRASRISLSLIGRTASGVVAIYSLVTGCQAFADQNDSSAAEVPRKMLRSALLILATLFGYAERGRRLHFPSPVYCTRAQCPPAVLFGGSK